MVVSFSLALLAVVFRNVNCQAADECGSPPDVEKAKVAGPLNSTYVLESVVTYNCDYGYIAGGSTTKTSKCVLDTLTDQPAWTTPDIICNPKPCGDPGLVQNARRSGSRFTFSSNVEYICNEGYKLSGQPRRYCQASGVWSGTLPTCSVINCERPDDPENGRAVYTSLNYNSELTYECGKGLQISSSEARICSEDGKWTGTEPFCRETECKMPDEPEFGTVELVGNKAKVGSLVLFQCDAGRKLIGSSSSKCLKTGEWTFETPRCTEPCEVKYVSNGELGKYEEQNSRRTGWVRVFRQMRIGTTLDEDEELTLKCKDGFVPKAEARREITVKCWNGDFLPEPECISTSCIGDPPATANGVPVVRSRQHGEMIWYRCTPPSIKVASGNVTCVWGTWTGIPPICGDNRCRKETLNYPGLIKGTPNEISDGDSFQPTCGKGYDVTESQDTKIYCKNKEWIGNLPPCTLARCKTIDLLNFPGVILEGQRILDEGEWFQPTCAEGYEFSNKDDNRIYCREGEWTGNLPPCSPAHCFNHPPSPENGRVKLIRAKGHGATVEFECFQFYELEGENTVICTYGQWSGSPPTCKDRRCYLKDLPAKEGVALTDNEPLDSGEKANILCLKGYTLRHPDVYCRSGKWKTQNALSPCREDDCEVKSIKNGEIRKEKTTPITNFWGTQTGTKTEYVLASIGSFESTGSSVFVTCRSPYKFQGEYEGRIKITCRRGEWSPFPVCLMEKLMETEAFEEIAVTIAVTPGVRWTSETPRTNGNSAENLAAVNNTDVTDENGDTVSSSLEGDLTSEISTIPPCSCKYNFQDSIVVAFDGTRQLKYRDDVYMGSRVVFHCKKPGEYRLSGPSSVECESDCSWRNTGFPNCIRITDNEISMGVYAIPSENMSIGPGGVFAVMPGTKLELICRIKSAYDKRNFKWKVPVGSNGFAQEVVFQGTRKYGSLYTLPEASRSSSGNYSCSEYNSQSHSITIEVKDVQCPEIQATGELTVSYANDRSFKSRANFHCFSPNKREGPSFVTCEASGVWSGPSPTCSLPKCSVGSLYDSIPEGVVPDVDENVPEILPYGHVLKLICAEKGMVLRGDSTANCSTDGKWKVEDHIICAPGCGSLKRKDDSALVISPAKQFYTFGESVILSCPEGKVLTEEIERILCFKSGWTPDVVPDCR